MKHAYFEVVIALGFLQVTLIKGIPKYVNFRQISTVRKLFQAATNDVKAAPATFAKNDSHSKKRNIESNHTIIHRLYQPTHQSTSTRHSSEVSKWSTHKRTIIDMVVLVSAPHLNLKISSLVCERLASRCFFKPVRLISLSNIWPSSYVEETT